MTNMLTIADLIIFMLAIGGVIGACDPRRGFAWLWFVGAALLVFGGALTDFANTWVSELRSLLGQ